MARGRLLNKTVSASLKFHLLPDDTCRLLATWTVSHLDMNGVFYGDAAMVKSFIFPRRTESVEQVEAYLQAMEQVGLIYRFEENGDVWQCWPGFADNQPNLRRDREKPEYPIPPRQSLVPVRQDDGSAPADVRQDDGSNPAEEKLSEVKLSEEQGPGADAPSPEGDPPIEPITTDPERPRTYEDWYTLVQEAAGKPGGRPAALRQMFMALYLGRDPPTFAYVGKVARKVGGAGRLCELLWQNCTRPPSGEVLAYVQAIAKDKNNGAHRQTPGGAEIPLSAESRAIAAALSGGGGSGGGGSG